jgi:hypothetical protein
VVEQASRPEIMVMIMTVHAADATRQAAEASGTDTLLLKQTLGTVLGPTIQYLRSSRAPLRASQDSAPLGHGRWPCRETS